MAKNLKLKIKNTQLAKAVKLTGLKSKLKKDAKEPAKKRTSTKKSPVEEVVEEKAPAQPIRRAKKRSDFAEKEEALVASDALEESGIEDSSGELVEVEATTASEQETETSAQATEELAVKEDADSQAFASSAEVESQQGEAPVAQEQKQQDSSEEEKASSETSTNPATETSSQKAETSQKETSQDSEASKKAPKPKAKGAAFANEEDSSSKGAKKGKVKEHKGFKTKQRTPLEAKPFDSRDRRGLRERRDDTPWRKRRSIKSKTKANEPVIQRPTKLSVRLPITLKDLASEMKLKASQLISKLFMQGQVLTLNDYLDDETAVQLLGHEFECEISIDTTEKERIQITDKSIREEIKEMDQKLLEARPPVIAFMGHVDHGKTSIIDRIRSSNRACGEAGAITQHIGAFRYFGDHGSVTILDTPGHEAFSAMRARGADVTDIVILVVAGDEGIRQQTLEAIQHARAADVPIVVALNKCDKPGFNAENVYRQLADNDLLPEAWGGSIITVNCSAQTGEGIPELLEMVMLQAEVMELNANPSCRARGSILESEMHKGLGCVATVLVQNGTLKKGDALVLGNLSGRVKTLRNDRDVEIDEAPPSTPVNITGLSGLPEAGEEFIVVSSEKEAKEIASARQEETQDSALKLQKRGVSIESLLQQAKASEKKVLNIILRADMQGSLEALKTALSRISSDKVEPNIIFSGAGEVSESDVHLAAASKAVIVGFHTQIESHAEALIKDMKIHVHLHDIIYHAVDNVKAMMSGMLDKLIEERDVGAAEVRATFKVSHLGVIAGCFVSEGLIKRNHRIRVLRADQEVWKGGIQSLKREKDDVREVAKGLECGILLDGFNGVQEGDVLQAFEVVEIAQEL